MLIGEVSVILTGQVGSVNFQLLTQRLCWSHLAAPAEKTHTFAEGFSFAVSDCRSDVCSCKDDDGLDGPIL